MSYISQAPIYMREKIISLIENEIINAQKGGEAKICIKINSLQDKKVINKLYEASNAYHEIIYSIMDYSLLQ